MTARSRLGKAGGVAALGLVAAGAVARVALDRKATRRRAHLHQGPEPLGSLRGEARSVTTPDGVRLHVEVDEPSPNASGLTVVFVHGYALNLDCWHYQRQALRGDHRLVFFDQRSHGRSSRSDSAYCTIDQLGRDLALVLDEVVPHGPVVLVGHSMGGMSVMALAEHAPQLFGPRVVGVGLVATSAGDLDKVALGLPGVPGRLLHRVGPTALAMLARAPAVVERSRQAGSEVAYMLTRRFAFGGDVDPELADFTDEMLASTPIGVVAAFFPVFGDHDRYGALNAMAALPVLVVSGTSDELTPASHGREIVRRLPSAELLQLDGAGHMAMLERAEEVNEALEDLLGKAAAEAVA